MSQKIFVYKVSYIVTNELPPIEMSRYYDNWDELVEFVYSCFKPPTNPNEYSQPPLTISREEMYWEEWLELQEEIEKSVWKFSPQPKPA